MATWSHLCRRLYLPRTSPSVSAMLCVDMRCSAKPLHVLPSLPNMVPKAAFLLLRGSLAKQEGQH